MKNHDRRKDELKRYCKNLRFRRHIRTKKFCKEPECTTCNTPISPVFSFFGRIGFNACNGRCSDIPFPEGDGSVLIYTASPVFELSPGFFLPENGALLFYDEALTLPVTSLGLLTIAFTGCRFGPVNGSNEFFYTVCF